MMQNPTIQLHQGNTRNAAVLPDFVGCGCMVHKSWITHLWAQLKHQHNHGTKPSTDHFSCHAIFQSHCLNSTFPRLAAMWWYPGSLDERVATRETAALAVELISAFNLAIQSTWSTSHNPVEKWSLLDNQSHPTIMTATPLLLSPTPMRYYPWIFIQGGFQNNLAPSALKLSVTKFFSPWLQSSLLSIPFQINSSCLSPSPYSSFIIQGRTTFKLQKW